MLANKQMNSMGLKDILFSLVQNEKDKKELQLIYTPSLKIMITIIIPARRPEVQRLDALILTKPAALTDTETDEVTIVVVKKNGKEARVKIDEKSKVK